MTKKIFTILFAVLIGFTFVVSASADTYMHIADNANKLLGEEFEELENIAIRLEDSYGVCVMLCIADETTGMGDDAYAEWIYTDNTDNENGIILLYNDSENTYAVFTSGSADEVFGDEAIKEMQNAGCEIIVMEVSSHALELSKVEPIKFDIGIFTGLSHEHLEFHGSMENYFLAKKRLMEKAPL